MTWPFSTLTMLIPRSEAIGAAGARPSASARRYSSPLRSRASAAPTRGSVQVTVRCRSVPASSRLSSPMEPSLTAPGFFRPGGGEGRLGGMVRVLVGRDAECTVLSRALAAGVCSVLGRLAAGRPLALFLDDLQWADQATLGLLPALADAAAGIPVMLIGCYRSDELPRDHRLRAVRAQLRRSRPLAEIDVGPLDDEDVTRMLTHLLGAKPGPALATAVASRAEGIPFAVEELALALRDDGANAAVVPDGIREAVLLRTARLSGQERRLLETAAVAGQEFDIDPVLAVCGLPAWPDGFTGAGLLTEVRDGRAAFRHSLTHEAAYTDIGWSRRRDLHR